MKTLYEKDRTKLSNRKLMYCIILLLVIGIVCTCTIRYNSNVTKPVKNSNGTYVAIATLELEHGYVGGYVRGYIYSYKLIDNGIEYTIASSGNSFKTTRLHKHVYHGNYELYVFSKDEILNEDYNLYQ